MGGDRFLAIASHIGVPGDVLAQIPGNLQRVPVGVGNIEPEVDHRPGRYHGGPLRSIVSDRGRAHARRTICRPLAAPQEGHHVHRFRAAAVFQEHAIPRMGLLVVLGPVENEGPQAVRLALDGMLVGSAVEVGLLAAVVFDRQIPGGFLHLPVAARPELRDPVWPRPTLFGDILRQRQHIGIGVEPHGVQVRAILVQLAEHALVGVADGRDHRMVRVDLVNHSRHVIHFLPQRGALGRGGVDFEFVAHGPGQQRGVILEAQDDLADLVALAIHGGLVFIAEARALLGERQAGENRQPQGLRLIEGIRSGANGIAAGCGQFLQVYGAIGALSEVRLAVPQESISAVCLDDPDVGRLSGRQGTAQHTEQRFEPFHTIGSRGVAGSSIIALHRGFGGASERGRQAGFDDYRLKAGGIKVAAESRPAFAP